MKDSIIKFKANPVSIIMCALRKGGGYIAAIAAIYAGAAALGMDIPKPAWSNDIDRIEKDVRYLSVHVIRGDIKDAEYLMDDLIMARDSILDLGGNAEFVIRRIIDIELDIRELIIQYECLTAGRENCLEF